MADLCGKTIIEKKAYMSDKNIREIFVPTSVGIIDDWAFARCTNLETVHLHSDVKLGRDVFKDCTKLRQIFVNQENDEASVHVSFLLVDAINLLHNHYLFDIKSAGTNEWFDRWDSCMMEILSRYDDEGYVALVAGGEEDYEYLDNDLEKYISNVRKQKIRICFSRLMHDTKLCTKNREILIEYLYNHRAGMKYDISVYQNGIGYSDNGYMGRTRTIPVDEAAIENVRNVLLKPQDESWRVVFEEHPDEEEYYKILGLAGCICSDNIESMLKDLGEKHPRMKALLLKLYGSKERGGLFENLNL